MRVLESLLFPYLDKKARWLGAKFDAAALRPRETQRNLLLDMVRRERSTAFGRDHKFGEIRSVEDFRKRVPIAGHEYVAPYVDRVLAGETNALFADTRIVMFAMTSGTSAARKFVPVTPRFVSTHMRGWYLWGLQTYEGRQRLIFQDKFNLTGDDDEFRTAAGVPCGSVSGLTARMQNPLVRRSYCLPAAAGKLRDVRAKQYLAWRIGLTRDVGSWVSPNPSTHLALARFGDENRERLVRDVRDGGLSDEFDWPEAVVRSVRRRLKPDAGRASQLERIVRDTGHLYPKDVWPNLGLLGCWLGGPLAAYLRFFPEYFGDVPKRDLGLIASESRMTFPLEDETAAGVLDLFGTFFEFVPVEEADGPNPTALLPDEIEEGCDYRIILTTASGLYRYDIQDVVRCVGRRGRTPLIEFLHKGRHFSNLTGEKLSEIQVCRAVDAASLRANLKLAGYALAPCFEGPTPYYGLFVEQDDLPHPRLGGPLAARVDAALCEANCEYESKRASQRLGAVRMRPIAPGAWEAFDRDRLAATGGVAEQYKRPCLFPDLDFADRLPAAAPAMLPLRIAG